jgi:hypothetical protein
MAQVIEVIEKGMRTDQRCDRCGAQAYVEVAFKQHDLLFCAHHYEFHQDEIQKVSVLIADHRPWLRREEGKQRDAAAAPK